MGLLLGPGFTVDIGQQVIETMHKRGDGPLKVVDHEIKKETQPRPKSVSVRTGFNESRTSQHGLIPVVQRDTDVPVAVCAGSSHAHGQGCAL